MYNDPANCLHKSPADKEYFVNVPRNSLKQVIAGIVGLGQPIWLMNQWRSIAGASGNASLFSHNPLDVVQTAWRVWNDDFQGIRTAGESDERLYSPELCLRRHARLRMMDKDLLIPIPEEALRELVVAINTDTTLRLHLSFVPEGEKEKTCLKRIIDAINRSAITHNDPGKFLYDSLTEEEKTTLFKFRNERLLNQRRQRKENIMQKHTETPEQDEPISGKLLETIVSAVKIYGLRALIDKLTAEGFPLTVLVDEEAVADHRIKLASMDTERDIKDGTKQWYFSCEAYYIDVVKDTEGLYSIYFKDRANQGKEAWLDQADDDSTPVGTKTHVYTDANGLCVNAIHTANGVKVEGRLYEVTAGVHHNTITFHQGDPTIAGLNGLTNEALLAVLIHRTEVLDGEYPSDENKVAIKLMYEAMNTFNARELRIEEEAKKS